MRHTKFIFVSLIFLTIPNSLKSFMMCPSKTETKKRLANIAQQLEWSTLTPQAKAQIKQGLQQTIESNNSLLPVSDIAESLKTQLRQENQILNEQIQSSTLTNGYKSMLLKQQKQYESELNCVSGMGDQPKMRRELPTAPASKTPNQHAKRPMTIQEAQQELLNTISDLAQISSQPAGPAERLEAGSAQAKRQEAYANQKELSTLQDLIIQVQKEIQQTKIDKSIAD